MASDRDIDEKLRVALSDRYRIERALDSGGMALVFLAEDLKHHRKVAVKVLRPDLARVMGAERFLREIEVAANLLHPHILPVFDSGDADGFLYYTMPRVRGGSLRDRLDTEKQLPVEEAITIAREIADALEHAHERGVVHRDVKPANILLTGEHALLADFGIAQALAEAGQTRLTQTGTSLGTPAYMSPEQAAGERDLDGRSDQYALACVLYEMLAGQPPFTGAQAETIVRQHLTADPPDVQQLRPTVPEGVGDAITRALAKRPADRFRTTRELSGRITGEKEPDPATGKTARRSWVERFILPALVVLIVPAIALLAWVAFGAGGPTGTDPGSDRVIVLPYENQTGNPELDPIGRMAAEWITEGLARTGEVQVIPNLMVLERIGRLQGQEGNPESGVQVGPLAAALDARITVSGSYYLQGEELELHSAITDLETAQSLGAVEPTRAPLATPGEAIEAAREGVMGVLATRLRQGTAWEVPSSVQPPTYQAFQHYAQAMELWLQERYDGAAHWFTQAYEADTTFLRSLLVAAAAHGNAGDPAVTDSLFHIILPRRLELAPYDRFRLDYGMAGNRGDIPARLRAARASVELVPSGTLRLGLVMTLIDVNRPAEALESLEEVWNEVIAVAGAWYPIWRTRADLHHLLGIHDRELEIARQVRMEAPGSLRFMVLEGRALAALGRMGELSDVVTEIMAAPEEPGTSIGRSLLQLAEELRAHGHRAEATEFVDRGLAWLDDAPPELSASPSGLEFRGRLLYVAERWVEAGQVSQDLLEAGVSTSAVLGLRGVSAARLGDTAVAEEVSAGLAELEEPFSYGSSTLWQARIQAVLGSRDEAMGLLRRAFGEGAGFGVWVHRDMDLALLRGHPPFEEYLRPKG